MGRCRWNGPTVLRDHCSPPSRLLQGAGPPSPAQAPFRAVAAHEALAASGITASAPRGAAKPRCQPAAVESSAQRQRRPSVSRCPAPAPGAATLCPPRPPAPVLRHEQTSASRRSLVTAAAALCLVKLVTCSLPGQPFVCLPRSLRRGRSSEEEAGASAQGTTTTQGPVLGPNS